jgi:hypothetical protein
MSVAGAAAAGVQSVIVTVMNKSGKSFSYFVISSNSNLCSLPTACTVLHEAMIHSMVGYTGNRMLALHTSRAVPKASNILTCVHITRPYGDT